MSPHKLDSEERRRVIRLLAQKGPMTHDELAQELGFEWDETQEIIRELRNDGLVSITLDRRYEAESTEEAVAG